MAADYDPLDTEIEKAHVELDQGLKACRSMLNDYRAVLTGEHDGSEGQATAPQWRTQEDSNL